MQIQKGKKWAKRIVSRSDHKRRKGEKKGILFYGGYRASNLIDGISVLTFSEHRAIQPD